MSKHHKTSKCRKDNKHKHHSSSSSSSCDNDCEAEPVIGLIGVGCAGAHLLNKLSKKYQIIAFEAGIDRRNDGFSYNLAIGAPVVHTQFDNVAPVQPFPPPPIGNTQWAGLTFQLPYSVTTLTEPATPGLIGPQSWTQGIMIGGSNEHIQGVYVNPSESRCDWWAEILKDPRYRFENLFPLLERMENFRSHTDFTTQTYEGSSYGPLDGPSELGSDPINRGYDGVIQVVQSSPSTFSLSLAQAIYNKFHDDLHYENFKIAPLVEDECSKTFNSGVNICVTTATETWLDIHRIRSSTARGYLNDSVMTNLLPDLPAPNTNPALYTINNGPQKGINGHNFTLQLNTLIQRIVFETKSSYPHGKDYWINNYPVNAINPCAFKRPLRAIGVEYGTGPNSATRVFVPCTDIICSLGVLATPILLMQSGIGPDAILTQFGIPKLFIQPNMGKYVSNHYGAILRWTGNSAVWGSTQLGTQNSNGYLPGPPCSTPKANIRRKFQYFSAAATNIIPPNWSVNLYDLNPKSTGFVETKQSFDTNGGLLDLKITPQYYTDPFGEDIFNLCWIARQVASAVTNADPTSVFTQPTAFPFPADDNVLFPLLVANFTAQAHYVGTCGMGPNPNVHCVDNKFLLRGTKNVRVCDASAIPLETDSNCVVYPVQNDGNTSRGVNTLSAVLIEQLLKSLH